ncbi:hypothetical protein D0T50_09560 [Bacteroides sp. 214]|uniref:caspase family protein n=1 Tax=Bacteroides sp. 214 TaxID=2302935 RepID=UPI0013D344A2|nr:caspase family protein [Bacteroides sp. 214]NDW13139.1 hypothetical protein [Bacteroides sp. 214]
MKRLFATILIGMLFPSFQSITAQEVNEPVRTIIQVGHTAPIIDYTVSADGRYLASTDMARKVIIWDLKRGKQLIAGFKPVDLQEGFSDIKFNPRNSEQLYGIGLLQKARAGIANNDKYIYSTYNWQTGKKMGLIAGSRIRPALQKYAGVAYEKQRDCSIVAFDQQTKEKMMHYRGYVVPLGNASIHKDDKLLFVMENNPQLWDLTKMELINRIPHKEFLLKDTSIVYINDRVSPVKKNRYDTKKQIENATTGEDYLRYGSKISTEGYLFGDSIFIGGYGQYITIWDTEANLLSSIKTPGHPVFTLDLKGDKLLAATRQGLCVGDVHSKKLSFASEKKNYTAYGVKFLPATNKFVLSTDGGGVRMGEIDNPSGMKLLKNVEVPVVAVSVDSEGNNVLAVGEDGVVYQYNRGNDIWFKYNAPFSRARVSSCAFVGDEVVAAGSHEGFIALWHRWEKESYKMFQAHNGEITSIIQSNDKRFVITTSNDGTTKIWNSETFEEIVQLIAIENSNEYIVIIPDNYYKASQDCSKAIHFVKGNEVYEYDQFDLKYNRPDIVMERMGTVSDQTLELYHKAWKKRLRKMQFTEDMLSDDFHTPTVEIVNYSDIPAKTTSSSIALEVKASDSKYALNRLLVWINGVPVYGLQGIPLQASPNQEVLKSVNLELLSGTNRVDVSCLNAKGAEAYKQTFEIVCEAKTKKSDLYLVSIGVSNYTNSLYNLHYADKDAKDVSALFNELNKSNLYGNIYSKVLANAEVTKESVLQVKDFLKNAGRNDVVVLFYAGHGVLDNSMDYYLAMSNMDFNNPAERGLMYEDFEMLLDGIKPLKKLMMIDACHSGEIDKEEYIAQNTLQTEQADVVFRSVGAGIKQKDALGAGQVNELLNDLFSDIRRGVGATILSSAGGAEVAVEGDHWQNGLFTFVLKEGLSNKKADRNGDGVITTGELHAYTRDRVVDLSQGRQQPTSRINNKQYEFTLLNNR